MLIGNAGLAFVVRRDRMTSTACSGSKAEVVWPVRLYKTVGVSAADR
jgi:hypothetical protein